MDWNQIVWALVALVCVGAAWDVVRRLSARASLKLELSQKLAGVQAMIADVDRQVAQCERRLTAGEIVSGNVHRSIEALQESSKQQDKAMLAISNKIESRAAEAAQSKWRR